jgi:hypothetical protein
MELTGMRAADWQPETVRLFLSGEYGRASDLYFLLTRRPYSHNFTAFSQRALEMRVSTVDRTPQAP